MNEIDFVDLCRNHFQRHPQTAFDKLTDKEWEVLIDNIFYRVNQNIGLYGIYFNENDVELLKIRYYALEKQRKI
jgi:hypothetical protein